MKLESQQEPAVYNDDLLQETGLGRLHAFRRL